MNKHASRLDPVKYPAEQMGISELEAAVFGNDYNDLEKRNTPIVILHSE
ncbi:MAG TPA: hypothetical protein PK127_05235 [Clostridiales bacterium]|nr:hypothetical protein [Clostridiales bacterium]HPV01860.1 hypothetical protein [Clostridiales bacterium]